MRFIVDRDWNGAPAPYRLEAEVTYWCGGPVIRSKKPECKCTTLFYVNKFIFPNGQQVDMSSKAGVVCSCVGHLVMGDPKVDDALHTMTFNDRLKASIALKERKLYGA